MDRALFTGVGAGLPDSGPQNMQDGIWHLFVVRTVFWSVVMGVLPFIFRGCHALFEQADGILHCESAQEISDGAESMTETRQAVRRLRLLIREDPLNTKLRLEIGQRYLRLRRIRAALPHLSLAAEQAPDHPEVWLVYSQALLDAKRRGDALNEFRRAIGTAQLRAEEMDAEALDRILNRICGYPGS